ncbi:MAG: hypothetical protein AAGC46_07960, partial [Solirubrobacteraceae bacterium]|nr:hypothetical protein [Patulibacter sp.]
MIASPPTRRMAATGISLAALFAAALPAVAQADPSNQPGWSATVQELTTGINLGYELGIDPLNRRLYAADAQGASYSRQFLPDGNGGFTDTYLTTTVQANTGKVVQLDLDTKAFLKNYSYTGLKGSDGTTVGGQYTLPTTHPTTGNGATTGIATASTQLTANNPYGVAVDSGTVNADTGLPDPTIVTVQTRTSSVAIYKSSATSPTDADVITAATSGLTRARTPVVDSVHHKAYVAGYNATTGVVVVFNTLTKAVEATIPVPGVDGLAIDTNTNTLYAGTYQAPGGNQVNVIDLSKVVTSDPLNKSVNTQAVVATITGVGSDSRPGYDEADKKLYVANSQSRSISVIDLDPAHTATYRTVIKTIAATGSPNSITVDPQRHLAYSADLGSKILSVIDTKTDTWVQGIPTTGNALDVDVDPTTGTAYVSSMTTGTTTGVGQLQAVNVSRPVDPAELPKGDKGDPGAAGATGAAGAD